MGQGCALCGLQKCDPTASSRLAARRAVPGAEALHRFKRTACTFWHSRPLGSGMLCTAPVRLASGRPAAAPARQVQSPRPPNPGFNTFCTGRTRSQVGDAGLQNRDPTTSPLLVGRRSVPRAEALHPFKRTARTLWHITTAA